MQFIIFFFFLMIRRPPRSTQGVSSAASDVYKRQVYFCATGLLPLRVLNGGGRGEPLNNVQRTILERAKEGSIEDALLDNTTGDFYKLVHQKQSKNWVPTGNVGLHNHLQADKFGTPGKYFIKTQTFSTSGGEFPLIAGYQKVTIKKIYLTHFLLEGVPREFMAATRNTWDPHPINLPKIQEISTNYRTLAENSRGPMIIEHGTTIAVQFDIDSIQNPPTQTLLNNFIHYYTLELRQFCTASTKIMDQYYGIGKVVENCTYTFKLQNSGMSFSKRKGILVREGGNASTEKSLSTLERIVKRSKSTNREDNTNKFFLTNKEFQSPSKNVSKCRVATPMKSHRKTESFTQIFHINKTESAKTARQFNNTPIFLNLKNSVPISQSHLNTPEKLRVNSSVEHSRSNSCKKKRPGTPFCRFREFQKLPVSDAPCVRVSGPYQTSEQTYLAECQRDKEKWITASGFHLYSSSKRNSAYKQIDNYVIQTPSQPPALHRFRSVDKGRWLCGDFLQLIEQF
eukprot:TRINITY_DN7906_c0_g1_i1.p1 TRINITY_DN7906_c0_g1~~TRINITY_DN7906_c0_g1_i1.p1  ORF type:complete len:512 (+),score=43.92 TRINITY_DN7906_c0_g1_i1:76-1611(+)